MFDSREQAQDFFEEYINDVDVLDIRCKKGDDVFHIDYCTCGIIELDEDGSVSEIELSAAISVLEKAKREKLRKQQKEAFKKFDFQKFNFD